MPTIKEYEEEIESLKQQKKEFIYASVARALSALHCEKNPRSINTEKLDRQVLIKIAKKINYCMLHMSGNCTLLSSVFLFNLKAEKLLLQVGNTYPLFQGLSPIAVTKLLFEKDSFQLVGTASEVKELEKNILNAYYKTQEKFYIIHNDSHQWNAVILIENGLPVVQFVDVWKTSNPVPTSQQFAKSYSSSQIFYIKTHSEQTNYSAVVDKIKRMDATEPNINLDTFKKAYLLQYEQSFFKNPYSEMKSKLKKIKAIDEVLNYAKEYPKSRTADVLKNLQSLSASESPFLL